MQRKILAICAALVAISAFAIVPAMASAHTLQDTVGSETKPLAAGAGIVASSTGTSFLKGSGLTTECNENLFTGTVHKNDGNEVQVTITHGWFQSNLNASGTECKSNLGNTKVTIPALKNFGGTEDWCIRTVPNTDNWELWGNACTTEVGSGKLTFVLDIGELVCKYSRTAAVKGTFTTETNGKHESSVLTMSNDTGLAGAKFAKEEGGFLCPSEGLLSEFKFDLTTDTGTSGSYPSTGAPVWIKEGA